MSKDRSASATIKGFLYQFDATILTILNKTDNATVAIECIEDIDIHDLSTSTTAVQCKYYESTDLTASELKEPVVKMLEGFLAHKKAGIHLKYVLYGYYKRYSKELLNEKEEVEISFDLMKTKLMHQKVDGHVVDFQEQLGATDADLHDFLSVFRFEKSQSFEEQQNTVIDKLKTNMRCDEKDAKLLFYNSALNAIANIAKEKDETKRSISKSDFLKLIDQKKLLFLAWMQEIKGEKYYIKLMKEKVSDSLALSPSKRKALFLDLDLIDFSDGSTSLFSLVCDLVEKYYKVGGNGAAHVTSEPWTVVLHGDEVAIKELKKELLLNNIYFNDGCEHIAFSSTLFNKKTIVNKTKTSKISDASFRLRLLQSETLKAHKESILCPTVVFFNSRNCTVDDYFTAPKQYFILGLSNPNHLLEILM